METRKTLYIPHGTAQKYNDWMQTKSLSYRDNDIPKCATIISWTVDFGHGYEVDLKVCSSIDDAPLWCEAVLFQYGSECCCSEIHNNLLGEWDLEDTDYCSVREAPTRKFILVVAESEE